MMVPYHFTKEGRGVLITKLNDHPNTRFILFSDADPDNGGQQYGYYTDEDGDRRESYSLHPSADPPWFECYDGETGEYFRSVFRDLPLTGTAPDLPSLSSQGKTRWHGWYGESEREMRLRLERQMQKRLEQAVAKAHARKEREEARKLREAEEAARKERVEAAWASEQEMTFEERLAQMMEAAGLSDYI